MIKIEHIEIYGWESAIRGMRNPMDSWDKSDTKIVHCDTTVRQLPGQNKTLDNCRECDIVEAHNEVVHILKEVAIGENDKKLMKQLVKAGTDHRKFMRMINVTMDITAPLYWWKEYDTYKVGTVANSCSTMHRIHEKEFTLDDFSHEHLTAEFDYGNEKYMADYNGEEFLDTPENVLEYIVNALTKYRKAYIETKDKRYWWQMIQLLPSSYNQKRTVQLNYEVLANMYHSRKNHKLDEWVEFCHTIETLPYSELITAERK